MKLILGSQSSTRKRLLAKMGYAFESMSPDVDEKTIRHKDPATLTLALARAKADALVAQVREPALLLTADTVGECGGEIFEKPADEQEFRSFFKAYETKPLRGVTAEVVVNTQTGKRVEGVVDASVWFHSVPEEVLARMLEIGDVFGYAAGFTMSDPLLQEYIARVEGEREILEGLPVALTLQLLREAEEGV